MVCIRQDVGSLFWYLTNFPFRKVETSFKSHPHILDLSCGRQVMMSEGVSANKFLFGVWFTIEWSEEVILCL